MGLERVVSSVCKLEHSRYAIAFPRLINRVYPETYTTQGVKDFFCLDRPWGGREIVSRKEKTTNLEVFPQRAVLRRVKEFFCKFWGGVHALAETFLGEIIGFSRRTG